MFQWVSLAMQDPLLHAYEAGDVKLCLEDFPPTLNATYARILGHLVHDSSGQQRCHFTIAWRWLAAGARPSTAQELRLAITLQEDDSDLIQCIISQNPDSTTDDPELETLFGTLLESLAEIMPTETETIFNRSEKVI
jgi:hypothetical protein